MDDPKILSGSRRRATVMPRSRACDMIRPATQRDDRPHAVANSANVTSPRFHRSTTRRRNAAASARFSWLVLILFPFRFCVFPTVFPARPHMVATVTDELRAPIPCLGLDVSADKAGGAAELICYHDSAIAPPSVRRRSPEVWVRGPTPGFTRGPVPGQSAARRHPSGVYSRCRRTT